ncbi:MAG: tol-pal system protein YbgF [Alphaproteobacteria bacterium]|nr:MAG: tol-pal system protein YbgF [Alphaproteobacteria bacterium]
MIGASPAWGQEGERPAGLFGLIFGGSERLGGDRNAVQPAVERTAQADAPDVVLRLDRLETQIRQLTGVIEQLQFRNQQLENQVRRMQEDGDARLPELGAKDLGTKGAARPAVQLRPQGPASVPATIAPAGRRGDAFDPSLNPSAPGAPHALGSIAAGPASRPGEMADAGMTAPQAPRNAPAGTAVATLPPSQTPKDEFDLAYGYVLRRDYVLAEEGLRAFLSKYPNDRLTGDATYWLGESLYQRQRYRDAAESFLNVSTKFEGNARAPNALVRLGQSLAALGEKEAACASLGEVLRKFPRASAGLRQEVEREQKRVRC